MYVEAFSFTAKRRFRQMSMVGKGRFSHTVVALEIELGALLVLVVLLQSINPF